MIRLLLLLAVTLPAALPTWAQQAQTPPVEAKKEPERRSLNLRLDNPSSFATSAPEEKEQPKGLPALGGDARKVEAPKREGAAPTPGGPFPKDTNPTR